MEWMSLSLFYEKLQSIKNKFVQVQTDDLDHGDQYTSQVRGQTDYRG
jgi:hypothetical protein